MTPLVTIGIPCHNAAQTLKAALDSALAQVWPICEVLVVDDGSRDMSAVIASAFGDRVNVIQTGRRGSAHARNLIMREARTEWIQYLDADDLLEPGKIACQLEETNGGQDADVIYSPVWVETMKNGAAHRDIAEVDSSNDLYAAWLSWKLPQIGGCLWRRSALLDMSGWREDQPCCQEYELYFRALREGIRWQYAPTPGAVYRISSDDTQSRRDPPLTIRVRTKLIDQMRKWMESKAIWKPEHAAIAGRACFEMARQLARIDLPAAVRYHRDRHKAGLIRADGPAAPSAYRSVYRMAGFAIAERLAPMLG